MGLRDFCHSLTLLPPGASVFHKHMSCFFCHAYTDIGKALQIISWYLVLQTWIPVLLPLLLVPWNINVQRTIASPGIVVVVVVVIVDINFNHTFHTHKLTVAI